MVAWCMYRLLEGLVACRRIRLATSAGTAARHALSGTHWTHRGTVPPPGGDVVVVMSTTSTCFRVVDGSCRYATRSTTPCLPSATLVCIQKDRFINALSYSSRILLMHMSIWIAVSASLEPFYPCLSLLLSAATCVYITLNVSAEKKWN